MSHLDQYAKAVWVFAIHHALESEGIDSSQIFSANNFNLSALTSIQDDVPRDKVNKLWEAAKRVSHNDAFCLKTIDFINEPFINALVSVTRACATIKQALELLQKFHTLISPELRLSIDISDNVLIKASNVELNQEWLPEDRDIILAIVAKHGFAIAGKEIKPSLLKLKRATPTNTRDYEQLFQCMIHFNADEDCLRYPLEVLDVPLPSANPHMLGHFQSYLEQSLEQQRLKQRTQKLSDKVERFLVQRLGPEFPTLSETASHFHSSVSAFKKHLKSERNSFQQIADSVRAQQACKLIKSGTHSLKEIAFRMGFANSSAFNRAFRRWQGVSPSEYAKQKADRASKSSKHETLEV